MINPVTAAITSQIIYGAVRSEEQVKEYLDTQALKNYAYAINDYYTMLEFLNSSLKDIVTNEVAYKLFRRVMINDVPKLIRRTCLLYQTQPDRVYSGDLSDEQQKVLSKTYKYYKGFYRLARALNTILVRPMWNEKTKQFDFVKLGRHFATVKTSEDNQYEMQELIYPKEIQIGADKSEIIYVHWTNERMWFTSDNNENLDIRKVLDDDKATEDNPYGRIPFSVLRLNECDDFWGNGMTPFVNITEEKNLKLMDALYKQWLSFGYPIGTNLNITAESFKVAPYQPIMLDNVRQDMVSPNLQFITPDHKVEADNNLIDWLGKTSAISEGLSASSMSQDQQTMSGYAKTIDNLELLEINNDDTDALTDFEIDLFQMMKLESEKYKGVKFGNLTLNEVNFKKYEFPKTSDEIWTEREYKYKYNLESEIDWLMQDRAGLTEEEAKEILKKNRQLKIELGQSRPTLFEQTNQGV